MHRCPSGTGTGTVPDNKRLADGNHLTVDIDERIETDLSMGPPQVTLPTLNG